MTQLEQALLGLTKHEGVEHVLLTGTDGLLVSHAGDGSGLDADRVAALVPGLMSSARAFGGGTGGGDAATIVLELESAVGIVTPLSDELVLVTLLRPGVAFPALLRQVRRDRGRLAALV